MLLKIVRDISRSQWFEIIDLLKRSGGMTIAELSQELAMSYMGVKQHCVELHKKGYLETWRRPKSMGRPEKVYRLTHKIDALFPQYGNEVMTQLLVELKKIYGPNVPEKLFFNYYKEKTRLYQEKTKGKSLVERAETLAQLRNAEGYISSCKYSSSQGLCILEYHNPLQKIADHYPSLYRMEEKMFQNVLETHVMRKQKKEGGQYQYIFEIESL